MRHLATILAVVGCGLQAGVRAQQPSERPSFEVASIRPSAPGTRYGLRILPGGRLSVTHATVQRLILTADVLHESQLAGGPSWLYADGFDIEARSSAGASTDRPEMMGRLRTLLNERFGLRTQTELRDAAVYALVLARADKKLGEFIRPSAIDCEAADAATKLALSRGEVPAGPRCGVSFSGGAEVTVMRYGAMTMSQIAMGLSQTAGRMVVDQTGLSGIFDVELRYTSDPLSSSDAPSIFTATQEQLGLRLESRRMSVPVMVVDRVERPTEN
ncbi:MAG TPA: TIGR03435 family protein [Vicinamibacterales bacterium]|nr:TIGR03435 family protein [Vicinamibacterales bacterium]